jgi:hypothetical protein
MKSHMESHVEHAKETMFKASTDEVHKHLMRMLSSVGYTIVSKTKEVFVLIKRDYTSVIGGQPSTQSEFVPEYERLARKGAKEIIREYDCVWEDLVNHEGDNAIGNDAEAMGVDNRHPAEEEARSPDKGDVEMKEGEDD